MTYPKWTAEEDELVRALYPSLGARGTTNELAREHFDRTEGAVKERAKNLGVRKDASVPRAIVGSWSDEELRVVRREFPRGGAERVRKVLLSMGYDRTEGAIAARASMLGVRNRKTKRRMDKGGTKVQVNLCMDTVLDRDVIDKLDSCRNRSDYVRSLIRKDING